MAKSKFPTVRKPTALSHKNAVEFIRIQLSEWFPELKTPKILTKSSQKSIPTISQCVNLDLIQFSGKTKIAIIVYDQDKFDRKGELTLAKFHQIVSKIDYLDKLGKNFHKVLVLTDFQAFVQTRKSLLNLGYNLERKSDMQKTEFSLKEYKNLFVIHEPFPILENNGWWKKQNYELTIPDILLGLKYGLLKKDEIPKLQELHYEKLKNVKGNFQEIIDYYYYKLGFRKSSHKSNED